MIALSAWNRAFDVLMQEALRPLPAVREWGDGFRSWEALSCQWECGFAQPQATSRGRWDRAIFDRSKEVLMVALPASQRVSTFFSLAARMGSPEADFFAK